MSQQPDNDDPTRSYHPKGSTLPKSFGRYRVLSKLGRGGFGTVYRAIDEQLQREVAVKVTRGESLEPDMRQSFLIEARTVAKLDHPHIVPVLDVGPTDQGDFYVVSKLIEGMNLADRIESDRPNRTLSLRIVEQIADALHYAHSQGLVHRDVKPANILLDRSDRPYLTDFGIALRETEQRRKGDDAGTPAYMSPEQARGLGHRLDYRSDIYSLGVVLYELLTGRRPFRSDNKVELMKLIATEEVRSPRLFDDSITSDLERICMKALARRASDRFTVARDFAEEIRWLLAQQPVPPAVRPSTIEPPAKNTPVANTPANNTPSNPTPASNATPRNVDATARDSDSNRTGPTKIVPKGLRSFDASDAGFFLDLLPGPFDREGFPEALRFWKTRIEETDSERTFKVGLIYGPSGCGKSSLMKAGLLPRLSSQVISVYVEATPDDTEMRLLRAVRKAIPDAEGGSLRDVLSNIRRRRLVPSGGKLLLILDQFEQWLFAESDYAKASLTDALLQCDGSTVQSIVMVREDFWISVSRFFKEMEISIERNNSAMVDLFDGEHAASVLGLFGKAYRKLPDSTKDWSQDQKEFIRQAINGLSQDHRVISVRIAVFSDMMKSRTWTTAALSEVGGIEGVGVTFLEEMFGSRHAPIQHRQHQEAVRGLLSALLPAIGTDIKGSMQSADALQKAAGYEHKPREFQALMDILDQDLRLITPVDDGSANAPNGSEADPNGRTIVPNRSDTAPNRRTIVPNRSEAESPVDTPERLRQSLDTPERLRQSLYYQLAHDYLVPSLREWLTRKQRETKKGRAELKLAERAAAWSLNKESKQLPTLIEWFQIRRLTEPAKWKAGEKVLMQRATRYHTTRALLATTFAIALILSGLGIKRWNDQRLMDRDAASLVSKIETADFGKLADEFKKLPAMRAVVDPKLKAALEQTKPDSDERLKLSLALLPSDPTQLDSLVERLQSAQASQVQLLVDQLRPHKDKILESLWSAIEGDSKAAWLPVASALADYDPSNERWRGVAAKVSDNLVRDPLRASTWIELLRPAALQLNPELKRIFAATPDATRSQAQIDLATDILETYAAADFPLLHELILSGRPEQFARMFNEYEVFRKQAIEQLRSDVARTFVPDSNASAEEVEPSRLRWIARQANAAVALMRLEDPQPVYQFLTVDRDPEALSQFIYRIRGREVSPSLLVKSFQELVKLPTPLDANERRQHILRLYGMILGLGEFTVDQLPATDRDDLIEQLSGMYGDHPSRVVHSALGWLLRRWGQEERVRAIDETPLDYDASGMREWYVMEVEPPADFSTILKTPQDADRYSIDPIAPIYFTMLVFPGDKFEMGEVGETETVEISGPIAVSDREMTWRQFSGIDRDSHRQSWEKQFKKELGGRRLLPEEPVFGVSWFDAVNYCRWLTEARMPGEKNQSYAKKELTAEQSKGGWVRLNDPKDWAWPMDPKKPGFRLLTEREWEYVARGDMETTYSFGTSEALLEEYEWFNKNSGGWSHPTAMLRPSVAGLFDIHGNLWEWTDDWYTKGSNRVFRGGSWDLVAAHCRTAYRGNDAPTRRNTDVGFRLALVPSGSAGLGPAEPGPGGRE